MWVQEVAERPLLTIPNNPRLGFAAGLGLITLTSALRWVPEGILPAGLPLFIAIPADMQSIRLRWLTP